VSETETFGRGLKERRQLLDLTQYALAAQSGCTVATIRKIEADGARGIGERRVLQRAALRRFSRGNAVPPGQRSGVMSIVAPLRLCPPK
jgi:transcriptional regulator with XRE-family HTH domain